MNPVPPWVNLLATSVPLLALAGSAVAYVIKLYRDASERRRNVFFELMKHMDTSGSIASKLAAVYQLRQFTEHREFIIRFCDTQSKNVSGADTATAALIAEMKATRDAMSV